jgi:hypothetical protein
MAESCIPDVVERLRTLLAKATPGPWKADRNLGCKRVSAKPRQYGQHKQAKRTEVASTPGLHSEAEDQANADLIAEVVTALPMLLDALSHTSHPVEWQARNAVIEECAKLAEDTYLPPDQGLHGRYVEAANQRAFHIARAIRSLAIEEGSHDH